MTLSAQDVEDLLDVAVADGLKLIAGADPKVADLLLREVLCLALVGAVCLERAAALPRARVETVIRDANQSLRRFA